jgi:hypothetical protein
MVYLPHVNKPAVLVAQVDPRVKMEALEKKISYP